MLESTVRLYSCVFLLYSLELLISDDILLFYVSKRLILLVTSSMFSRQLSIDDLISSISPLFFFIL